MFISGVNFNYSQVIPKKYNNVAFGNGSDDNQTDSFVNGSKGDKSEQNKIKKFCSLVSSTPDDVREGKRKLNTDEANKAVLNGYEGKKLDDYVFALQNWSDIDEAQTYAESELSGFYTDYESEFKESPYSKHLPSDVSAFMQKHEFTPEEAFYPIGMNMDDETLGMYKTFLSILKYSNQDNAKKSDKKDLKFIADEAVKLATEEKEARIEQIADVLADAKRIPQDMAYEIAKSPVLLKRVDVIKALFPANEDNPAYRIKPSIRFTREGMLNVLRNQSVIDNFDRFVALITVDKKTNMPVNKKMRALTVNEAIEAVSHNLPDSDINTLIFFCNCDCEPKKAVEMILADK